MKASKGSTGAVRAVKLPESSRQALGAILLASVSLSGPLTVSAGPVRFADATAALGIDFTHRNGISAEKYLPETYGSGIAWLDSDGDGDFDLYLVNSGHLVGGRGSSWNRLYRNDGDRFRDATREAGLSGSAYGMGVAAADYDNDGDQDLYLANWGPDQLLRNDGSIYTDVTPGSGVGHSGWSSSAVFADGDNDGHLDLYVTRYVTFDLAAHPWCGRRDMGLRFYCDPSQFAPTRDLYFANGGRGSFADRSAEAGVDDPGNGLGAVSGDFDGDGDSDIYVANDMTPNFLYSNRGPGRFDEVGLVTGTALSADGKAQAGMGVDAGDYDNDGDLDLFVTNYQLEHNALYRNDGSYYAEVSFATGLGKVSLNYLGFGTGFIDYDNDGWLDLFVANGHVHDNIEQYDALVTYRQTPQLLRNLGGRFEDVSASLGPAFATPYAGRGAAFADYDADGDTDIALLDAGRGAVILRNEGGNAGHWLDVELEGRRNRDAIGAKLWVGEAGERRFREIHGGVGYQSSSPYRAHFGLGSLTDPGPLRVRWPSGVEQVITEPPVDGTVRLVEPAP